MDLYCDDGLYQALEKLEDELRFSLITSYARIHPLAEKPEAAQETEVDRLFVLSRASEHAKCTRCWHHREDVGANVEHPELCGRCVENVDGEGEARRFT